MESISHPDSYRPRFEIKGRLAADKLSRNQRLAADLRIIGATAETGVGFDEAFGSLRDSDRLLAAEIIWWAATNRYRLEYMCFPADTDISKVTIFKNQSFWQRLGDCLVGYYGWDTERIGWSLQELSYLQEVDLRQILLEEAPDDPAGRDVLQKMNFCGHGSTLTLAAVFGDAPVAHHQLADRLKSDYFNDNEAGVRDIGHWSRIASYACTTGSAD